VLAVKNLAVRGNLTGAFANGWRGGRVTIVRRPRVRLAGGLEHDPETCLATDTFEEGAAWFKAKPAAGQMPTNTQGVTQDTRCPWMAMAQMGFGSTGAATVGGDHTLVDFEETMGKDTLDGVKELLGRHATPDDIAKAVVYSALRVRPLDQWPRVVVDGGITGAAVSESSGAGILAGLCESCSDDEG